MQKIAIHIIINIIISLGLWKIIGVSYNKFLKEKKQIHFKFFKNFLQASVIIFSLYQIGSEFPTFEKFSTSLLASSSLLVVVL